MNIQPLVPDGQVLSQADLCAAAVKMKIWYHLNVFSCHKNEFCSSAALAGVSGCSHAVGRAQQTECVNRRQQHKQDEGPSFLVEALYMLFKLD